VRVCICISLSVSLAHTRTHTCDNGSEEGVGVASALSLLALSVAYFGACERGSEWRAEREIEIESRVTCSFGRTTLL